MSQRAKEQEQLEVIRTSASATSRMSFARRSVIAVSIVALAVALASIVWYASEVLLLAFAGVLLAVGLRGLSDWVHRHTRLARGWSLLLIIVAIVALIALTLALFAASLADQVSQLTEQLPQILDQLRQRAQELPGSQQLTGQLSGGGGQGGVFQAIGTFFSTSLGALANVAIILFLGVYFAAEPDLYLNGIVRLVPQPRRARAREVLQTLGYTLRWWLVGQLLTMTVVGVLTTVGLLLLGVPGAPILGLLAGILDFVPNVGPIIAAVPGVLLAFSQGSTTGLLAIGVYVVVQILEGYILYPLIQERAVELPPALTILMLVLMGIIFGVLGLLLATPILAVVLVLIKMLYVEDVLGDDINVAGEPG